MQTNKTSYVLEVTQDEDPQSPREWDNIGIMACKHRRYEIGDKAHSGQHFAFSDCDSWEEVAEYARKELGALVVLPLYLYDHSGITMRTTPFSCAWDSGQVGVIYTTREKCDEMGLSPNDIEKLKEYLVGEVKTYDQYLTGDVWSYQIKEVSTCDKGHEHAEIVDACSGFFGQEEAESEGQSVLKTYAERT